MVQARWSILTQAINTIVDRRFAACSGEATMTNTLVGICKTFTAERPVRVTKIGHKRVYRWGAVTAGVSWEKQEVGLREWWMCGAAPSTASTWHITDSDFIEFFSFFWTNWHYLSNQNLATQTTEGIPAVISSNRDFLCMLSFDMQYLELLYE